MCKFVVIPHNKCIKGIFRIKIEFLCIFFVFFFWFRCICRYIKGNLERLSEYLLYVGFEKLEISFVYYLYKKRVKNLKIYYFVCFVYRIENQRLKPCVIADGCQICFYFFKCLVPFFQLFLVIHFHISKITVYIISKKLSTDNCFF